MLPELVVSKQSLRQVEGSCMVHLKREEGKQNVGFSSRPFVLCGLPVRKLPINELLYERRNGNFLLQITGHPTYGLPFGQDRIVPIYLATLAIRQQSQTVRFRTAAEMLETFGMHKGGKEYRRLIAAFERIFGATIIVLSDQFYQEITSHPIPADLEAVKMLAGAPAVLDLFMWLSYRCLLAKGPEAISLLGPQGLASQIGSIEYARPRRFREKVEQWLDSIRILWPECPARISSDGMNLIVDKPVLCCNSRGPADEAVCRHSDGIASKALGSATESQNTFGRARDKRPPDRGRRECQAWLCPNDFGCESDDLRGSAWL
jgi:hypothetical protein